MTKEGRRNAVQLAAADIHTALWAHWHAIFVLRAHTQQNPSNSNQPAADQDIMLASATEVEVELHVPDDVSTFFGVTWAQDPRKDKVKQGLHASVLPAVSFQMVLCNIVQYFLTLTLRPAIAFRFSWSLYYFAEAHILCTYIHTYTPSTFLQRHIYYVHTHIHTYIHERIARVLLYTTHNNSSTTAMYHSQYFTTAGLWW